MSTLEVKILKPYSVEDHFNADRLSVLVFGGEGGWTCVCGRNQFTTNDLVLYIPPDAMLPDNIMESLKSNKITMKSNRLRAIKIRGVVSEGLALNPKDWLPEELIKEDNDVTEYLGITKYEPPKSEFRIHNTSNNKKSKKWANSLFKKYTDIERFEKIPKIFSQVEEVVITKKYHGTNFRVSYIEKEHLTVWERIKKLFTRKHPSEYLVGSHNVIKTEGNKNQGFYQEDVYNRVAKQYDFEQITKNNPNLIIFGEIIGPGIQKGYEYGIEEGNLEIRIFDIYDVSAKEWRNWNFVKYFCETNKLPIVEEVYRGPWNIELKKLAQDVDVYGNKKYNREGVVVKDAQEIPRNNPYHSLRSIAKIINPDYLLDKNNSDFH